ncbi:MAG: 4-phosphoerythronate dehydrogenase [Tannerella sp.]|nr:4-phosphoerythronate dehydrogenase [Tannerella sp.]
MKIIADDKIPFLKGVLEPYADIIYLPGAKTTAEDVRNADAIFTRTRTKCDEALLKGSTVRLIATATIGFDHIDTAYCEAAGIRWINAPGCNSQSVQQYITAAIATWVYQQNLKFSDLTVGVIGVGNVGSKVAKAAEALGMGVLLNDPPRADKEGDKLFVPLDTLLAGSDIVTCHTPLSKEGVYPTYHLASDTFFGKMKDGAVFINTSRGPVTDTKALKQAVKNKLSSCILDVWEGEPNPDPELLNETFIGTPHIAGYSSDGKANGTAMCVQEFCCFFGIDALKNWYPESIPHPPMPTTFSVDGNGKSNEQILYEAITHTYPIREDSDRLKQNPAAFEELRGGYRIRREFKNFTIKPENVNREVSESLRRIGFKIENAGNLNAI